MTFVDFIHALIARDDLFTNKVTCIQLVSRRPLGILHALIQKAIRNAGMYGITVHEIYTQDFSIEVALAMPLCTDQLSICYIATESDGVMKRLPPAMARTVASYTGYHKLLYVCTPEDKLEESDFRNTIIIDDECSAELYRQFVLLIQGIDVARKNGIYTAAITHVRKLNISDAVALARYEGLLGQNTDAFIAHWLDHILMTSPSLFTLAQYLFARDLRRFHMTWIQLCETYPPEFWVSFWGEQFWQAIVFITVASTESVASAGKVTKGLPFSFMRQDYRKHTIQRLSNSLESLYALDLRIKQGGITTLFEPIFAEILKSVN